MPPKVQSFLDHYLLLSFNSKILCPTAPLVVVKVEVEVSNNVPMFSEKFKGYKPVGGIVCYHQSYSFVVLLVWLKQGLEHIIIRHRNHFNLLNKVPTLHRITHMIVWLFLRDTKQTSESLCRSRVQLKRILPLTRIHLAANLTRTTDNIINGVTNFELFLMFSFNVGLMCAQWVQCKPWVS